LTELDGNLWGWGWNVFGELGLGHKNIVSSPTKLSLTSIRNLQVGAYHVIAVCSNIFDIVKSQQQMMQVFGHGDTMPLAN
jgi:hypothetical protein